MRRVLAAVVALETRRKRWAVARAIPTAGRPLMVLAGVVVLVTGVIPAGFTIATGALVGAVASAHGRGVHTAAGGHVVVVLVVLAALFVLQQIAGPIVDLVRSQLGWRVNEAVQLDVIGAACDPVGVGHLEDPALLDKFETARGGQGGVLGPGSAASGLVSFAQRRVQGWATLLVLAKFAPWLTAFLLVELSISFQLYARGLSGYAERWATQEEDFRRTAYLRQLGLDQDGAKEIRVFGLGAWIAERYRFVFHRAMSALWSRRRRQTAEQVVPIAMDVGGLAVALTLIVHAAVSGSISVGQLTTYVSAALGGIVLTMLGNDELMIAFGSTALNAANDVVAAAQRAEDTGGERRAADGLPGNEIRFESVAFAYPGREPVFDGLNLTVPAGRSLAIVGENGAGKTTLVKLLARLYEPTGGRITVDGVDLRDIDARAWQRRVAAIFQDYIHYDAYSLADNIGVGSVEHLTDRAGIETAARRAGAIGIVADEHTWEQPMSRQYEGGLEISGGQWQRVALARALFATQHGAGVLVLDEPTSNLDARAEAEIYDRFLDLTRGVTTIVISHRFSTVRRADHIVVLDAGTVCEQGGHDELVAAGGRYAEMFRLQASHYDEAGADA